MDKLVKEAKEFVADSSKDLTVELILDTFQFLSSNNQGLDTFMEVTREKLIKKSKKIIENMRAKLREGVNTMYDEENHDEKADGNERRNGETWFHLFERAAEYWVELDEEEKKEQAKKRKMQEDEEEEGSEGGGKKRRGEDDMDGNTSAKC